MMLCRLNLPCWPQRVSITSEAPLNSSAVVELRRCCCFLHSDEPPAQRRQLPGKTFDIPPREPNLPVGPLQEERTNKPPLIFVIVIYSFFFFYLFFIHNSFWGCYARGTRLSSKRASDSKLLINWYTYSRSAWGLRACCRYFCWVVFVSPIFFIKSTGLGFEPSLQSKCGAEDELKTI